MAKPCAKIVLYGKSRAYGWWEVRLVPDRGHSLFLTVLYYKASAITFANRWAKRLGGLDVEVKK